MGFDVQQADCLVVGCGLSGSVIARFLAEELGKCVIIMERREHIAGNMYDYIDKHGILVHKYGPHTFHTEDKRLYDYICRFGAWQPYRLTCMALIDGIFTPSPFNFQTIDDFYPAEHAGHLKNKLSEAFPSRGKATIVELLAHPDQDICQYARFLFEKDYSLYTAKQWGVSPAEIDPSVLMRVPVYFSYELGYFDDPIQVMPKISYTRFFEKLLDHPNIKVMLGVEALEHLSLNASENELMLDGKKTDALIVYTGALDELFDRRGALPYRSLRFDWRHENIDSFQPAPVVAYPQAEGFTRITEYKKLPVQKVPGTTYAIEYPLPYNADCKTEPYYPVLTKESQALYQEYRDKADKVNNLICCGRLGDFQYYNMDRTLQRALEICDKLKIYFDTSKK